MSWEQTLLTQFLKNPLGHRSVVLALLRYWGALAPPGLLKRVLGEESGHDVDRPGEADSVLRGSSQAQGRGRGLSLANLGGCSLGKGELKACLLRRSGVRETCHAEKREHKKRYPL